MGLITSKESGVELVQLSYSQCQVLLFSNNWNVVLMQYFSSAAKGTLSEDTIRQFLLQIGTFLFHMHLQTIIRL